MRYNIFVKIVLVLFFGCCLISLFSSGQVESESESVSHVDTLEVIGNHSVDSGQHDSGNQSCGQDLSAHTEFDPGAVAFHHISDQNIYSIGPWHLPLPCIFYIPGEGWEMLISSKFEADDHGMGRKAYNRFVLYEGSARHIIDESFPGGVVDIGEHSLFVEREKIEGEVKEVIYLCFQNKRFKCDSKSTIAGGLFGGGITSFHDFSITKVVATMLMVFGLLSWMFLSVARAYKVRKGMAPSGVQSFIEPIFVFIQEDVAKPFLGNKWERFLPFLMAQFFFILGLNLFGQIPIFGGGNVTGNLSVTLTLAIIVFIITTVNGNKHYWGHIFNMPGIPGWVKVVVTPIEFMGLFIKPVTLMLRLFGNITAGHMVIVIFVSLIFIFGKNGENPAAAWGTSVGSILLTMFMMAIELLVALIQAFVFTILTASYIGAATEENHDH